MWALQDLHSGLVFPSTAATQKVCMFSDQRQQPRMTVSRVAYQHIGRPGAECSLRVCADVCTAHACFVAELVQSPFVCCLPRLPVLVRIPLELVSALSQVVQMPYLVDDSDILVDARRYLWYIRSLVQSAPPLHSAGLRAESCVVLIDQHAAKFRAGLQSVCPPGCLTFFPLTICRLITIVCTAEL